MFGKPATLNIQTYKIRNEKALILPTEYWTPKETMLIVGCFAKRRLALALQGDRFLAFERSDKVANCAGICAGLVACLSGN